MLVDGLKFLENSRTTNLVFPVLTEFEKHALQQPDIGEVLYQSNGKSGLYVYTGTEWMFSLDTASIATLSGIIPHANLPAFTGDVESIDTSNILTLKELSIIAGDYNYVTVNKKGQVIAAHKYTKISDLGIDDVYSKSEIDALHNVKSINGKDGIILKLSTDDIEGLSPSATIDTTDATNITKGKLSTTVMPNIVGDIVASNITNNLNLELKNITTLGDFNSVTINNKGLVTAGHNYTNIAELGITDVYTKSEIDNIKKIVSINNKSGIITKLEPTDINGLSNSATIDATDANNITVGTLSKNRLPSLTGDVLLTAGSDTLTLKTISTAGTYNSIIINDKGLVTSGYNYTNIHDLGITDVYTKTEIDAELLKSEKLSNKNVPQGYAGLDGSGKILTVSLPELVGDVLLTAGTNTLNLKTISNAGTYNSITINDKGLVTAGHNYTNINDLGITDVYTKLEITTELLKKEDKSDKNTPQGYAGLDDTGRILTASLPIFGGDVTSEAGDNRLFLTEDKTSGIFYKTSVNTKGLVISGASSLDIDEITNLTETLASKALPSDIVTAIDNLKNNVAVEGNTLKKLYDLIIAGYNEIVVANNTERDSYNVKSLPTNIMVTNDGDGHWALYKATSTGINASFVKISDPDLLNASIGYVSENVVNKSNDTLLGGISADDIKYPSQKAVKSYVDSQVSSGIAGVSLPDIITSGTSTKVSYNTKGLITVGSSLESSDIPSLDISKITNLQISLDDKVVKNSNIIAGTGIKVSYDAKGLILSSTSLEASDIPNLDAAKITTGVIDVNRLPSNIVTTVDGKLPTALVPSLTLGSTVTPSSVVSMNTDTTSTVGTVSIITNDPDPTKNGSYIKADDGTWKKMTVPSNTVSSINAKTGAISKILPEDIADVFENDTNKTLLSSKLPLFDGDVISTTSSKTTLNLKPISGLTEGVNYSSVKINNKGLVVSGIIGDNYTKSQIDDTFLKKSIAGNRNAAEGFVGLNTSKKIDSSLLPAITLNDIKTVTTIAQRDGLTVKSGDVAIVTENSKSYIVASISPTVWIELLNPTGGVSSVNGSTGAITLDLSNIPGTLSLDKLPSYTNGDVISNASKELELKTINGLSSGSFTKLTINTKGQVVSGSNITASDIPELSWNKITTDKPSSLNGFGITDNVAILDSNNKIPYTLLNRDIIEGSTLPSSGEINKIYVNTSDNSLHRYDGLSYIKVGGQDLPDVVTAGDYNTVTINAKGLVTAASNTDYIPSSRLQSSDNGTSKLVTLDDNDKIPQTLLPSMADDVLEFDNYAAFPSTNIETGKIYIDKSKNDQYRYNGSEYIKLSNDIITVNTFQDLPTIALQNVIYIDKESNTQYYHNGTDYIKLGGTILDSSRSLTINQNLMLTNVSKKIQNIKASKPNLVIITPDVTKLSIGLNYVIKNDGQLSFQIADRLGNWIAEVKPYATIALLLTDNTKNIFNYTENTIKTSGISGKWVALIGEQTFKPNMMFDNPKKLENTTVSNIKSIGIDDNYILSSYISNGKVFTSIIDNSNHNESIINTLEIDSANDLITISKHNGYFIIAYKNNTGLHLSKLTITNNVITKQSSTLTTSDQVKDVKIVNNIVGYISSSNHLNVLTVNDSLTTVLTSDYGLVGDNFNMVKMVDKLLIVYNYNGIKSVVAKLTTSITYSPVYEINQKNSDHIQLYFNGDNVVCSYYEINGYVKMVVLSSSTYNISNTLTDVVFFGDDIKIAGALISSLSIIGYNKNIICSYANKNQLLEFVHISIDDLLITINNHRKIKHLGDMVNMVYIPSKPSALFNGNNGYLNII